MRSSGSQTGSTEQLNRKTHDMNKPAPKLNKRAKQPAVKFTAEEAMEKIRAFGALEELKAVSRFVAQLAMRRTQEGKQDDARTLMDLQTALLSGQHHA